MSRTDTLPDCAEYIECHLLNPPASRTETSNCCICQEPFNSLTGQGQVVILVECGHAFCRVCILSWFYSGHPNANTCPLDRTELFLSPVSSDPDRTTIETARGRETIVLHGRLTREGCRHVIRDLWIETGELVRVTRSAHLDVVLDGELPELVQVVVPGSASPAVREWLGLVRFAKLMVGWHNEGGQWADVWQGPRWLSSPVLSGLVEELFEACGSGHMGDEFDNELL